MSRNSAFDNAKLLMILLVVFGHLIEPMIKQSEYVKIIYMSIYSFHMPVFIILAGVFTKAEVSKEIINKNIRTLIVPFIAFTVLYEIFNILGTGGVSHYTLSWKPYWVLWFLFSMFVWKVTLPVILQFRYPLFISIFISLCAGYISDVGYFLGISRTLYFFPFFILGYKLGSAFQSTSALLKIPKFICVFVLLLNIGLFWAFNELSHQWLYGSFSYKSVGATEWHSFLIRLAIYIISITSSISILLLMPVRQSALSKSGQNSLFVYLWHGFFVKIAMYFGVMRVLADISIGVALVSLFLLSILITVTLSRSSVAIYTDKLLFEPVRKILLVKA